MACGVYGRMTRGLEQAKRGWVGVEKKHRKKHFFFLKEKKQKHGRKYFARKWPCLKTRKGLGLSQRQIDCCCFVFVNREKRENKELAEKQGARARKRARKTPPARPFRGERSGTSLSLGNLSLLLAPGPPPPRRAWHHAAVGKRRC